MNRDTEHPTTLPLELNCKVCGHTWIRRIDKPPKVCPRCKHYDWMRTSWETEKDTRHATRLQDGRS